MYFVRHIRASKREQTMLRRKAAELLDASGAMAVVSGYACPLYAEIYENRGWKRHDKQAGNNSGDSRTESVWLNARTTEALGGWLL